MSKKQIALNLFLSWVVSTSLVVSLASLRLNQSARQENQALQAVLMEDRRTYEREVTSLYLLLSQQGSHTKTIMNMVMRNHHYINPQAHDGEFHRSGAMCPECADLYRRLGEAGSSENELK
jgi:hypothetical protein